MDDLDRELAQLTGGIPGPRRIETCNCTCRDYVHTHEFSQPANEPADDDADYSEDE